MSRSTTPTGLSTGFLLRTVAWFDSHDNRCAEAMGTPAAMCLRTTSAPTLPVLGGRLIALDPERYGPQHKRTLQRRIRDWRVARVQACPVTFRKVVTPWLPLRRLE